jgi:FkbM family methyltransferase
MTKLLLILTSLFFTFNIAHAENESPSSYIQLIKSKKKRRKQNPPAPQPQPPPPQPNLPEPYRDEEVIVVNKNNVIHKFVRFDAATDHFVQNVFPGWEKETFEIFEQNKNDQGIAIDIGAWIGTTAIWLAKNFHHVLSIEADKVSLSCLEKNLLASKCANVTICGKAISDISQQVIYGPRGNNLNESTSYLKQEINSEKDHLVQSSTFKQILHDYIFTNHSLDSRKVTFIKCDIEGSEENILEDVLHFAYCNDCTVYISFHLDWWNDKEIRRFDNMFRFFTTNCPEEDVCGYIKRNPFTSLLFRPKRDAGVLVKENLTSVIIGYNQLTYIRNMVKQLEKYTSDIVIIDNVSDYKPLIDYYENEFNHTLLKMDKNYGHLVYHRDPIQKLVGDIYILTDPDLQFNPNLPRHFIRDLIEISNYFQAHKVGFALLIDADDLRTDVRFRGLSIQSWESQFWKKKIAYPLNPTMELFSASIDTTFALINRRFANPAIRVAGDYTCKHIPWHINFQNGFEPDEYESYLKNNKSANWFK